MKKANIISLITFTCLITLSLVSCGSSNSSEDSSVVYKPPTFKLDTRTVHKADIQNNKEDTSMESSQDAVVDNTEDTHDTSSSIGEIIIDNNDNSIDYEIVSDTDIVYDNRNYHNLYDIVQKIDSKYDKNTLINFIVKTYNPGTTDIYLILDSDENINNDEYSVDISIDEQLSEYSDYIGIKEKYNNEPANWCITIMDSNRGHRAIICGCHSYIVMFGLDTDATIDMSIYDLTDFRKEMGLINSTDEEQSDTDEEQDNNIENEIANIEQ